MRSIPVEKLEEKVKQIFNDKECGNIFRIKGFMQSKPDQWIELNATHQNITTTDKKRTGNLHSNRRKTKQRKDKYLFVDFILTKKEILSYPI